MYGNSFNGIGTMLIIGFIAIIFLVILGSYDLYRMFKPKKVVIESKTLIIPEIKLHTDGKVVDTIYVYKLK